MHRLAATIVFLSIGVNVLRAEPTPRKANSVERIVRFDYPAINASKQPQDIKVYLPLPQTTARQEVLAVHPEPGYERIIDDEYGNRIVEYVDKAVPPGQMRRHGWMAAVRTYAVVYGPTTGIAPLGEQDRARYTRDTSNYQIASPVVTELRDKLVKPEMTDVEKTSAIFSYLTENFKYVRDDKWDPAPEVLKKKEGSCSEYTYSFLSLLRAGGIPCRYTGGFLISTARKTLYDNSMNEDAIFHRWVEVYLKDYGWFPVDGARAGGSVRRFGNYLDFWGRVPADSLQVYWGDGGADNPLGWDYVGNAKGQGKGPIRTDGVAFWIEAPADKLKSTIDEVEAALAKDMPPESLAGFAKDTLSREVLFFMLNRLDRSRYANLAEELFKAHHPAAIYFSVYCDQIGAPLPAFLGFQELVDEYLKGEILKHRTAGTWNWGAFEHWWRKARPEISFLESKNVFVLNNKNIDLN